MSSLGIFDKETKTYKKVADLSKPAVIDSSMSDTSTKAVQNKVVKSYVDGTFKRKLIAKMEGDGKTSYCQLCTIRITQYYVNTPIEITVQERGRATLDRLTVLFDSVDNNDPALISFKVFGEFGDWYISKRAASTWVIYGAKNEPWGGIRVVDCIRLDNIDVTWDVTGVTALPDSKTKAVWGGNVNYAVSASTVNGHTVNSDVPSGAKFTDTVYDDTGIQNEINALKKSVSDGKTTVANAITAKGVTTATDATFATMANNISQITTGVDTSDATATASQILTGQTAYVKGSKVTGTLGTKTDIIRTDPETLRTARQDLVGASVGNYALFAGGTTTNGNTDSTVDAYDSSLARTNPNALRTARRNLAGASFGNYALFAGGTTGSSDSTVDAYNSSLTRSTPPALSTARSYLAGASVGDYALFAGGYNSGYKSEVDAYDSSLARITPTALSTARQDSAGASVGNYALFAGGYNSGTYVSTVDAYNSSLTRTNPTTLRTARRNLAGASVGNYALFAGGTTTNGSTDSTVDAYNSSLTRTNPNALSTARSHLAGASVGNYALFAGGAKQAVDAYNSSLTRITAPALSTAKSHLAGASVGNYALFAGGTTITTGRTESTVNAYERPHISIPAQKIYL